MFNSTLRHVSLLVLFLVTYLLFRFLGLLSIAGLDLLSVDVGEEVVFEVFDLLFELLTGLRLEAVEQVLLEVVEGLNLGGAVAVVDRRQHVDQLPPLLRLSEHKHERVE